MKRILDFLATALFYVAAIALLALAVGFVGWSLYEIGAEILAGAATPATLLGAVGGIVVALAIGDVASFLIEQQSRDPEMRAAGEARRTLTQFLAIIIIAVSLKALVIVAVATEVASESVMPAAALLLVVAALLVALGVYQWLSRTVEDKSPEDD